MEKGRPRWRKRLGIPMAMLALSTIALLLVGIAEWLTYINAWSKSTAPPPRPAENPVLVLESSHSDSDFPPPATLPDLSQVDRRLIEPVGLVKPRYCLLVFGPQAKTRVWIVEDREAIYVDRNANGDLREAGEALASSERPKSQSAGYHDWTNSLGALSPAGQSKKHRSLKLVHYRDGDGPINSVLSVRVEGVTLQYAGWGPLFTDSRETAPIVHFGGPVLAKPLRFTTFRTSGERQELHFCLGTPGLGMHSFAYLGYETVPANIRPAAEIAWPTVGAVFKERFALSRRC